MKQSDNEHQQKIDGWLEARAGNDRSFDLSIVIPAYNEQWRLPTTLIDIIDYLSRTNRHAEIIVVDDGSTDLTVDTVRKFERINPSMRLLRIAQNRGKGHAVRSGVLNAYGRWVLFTDADGSTPIAELERLETALRSGGDIAIGSRALPSESTAIHTASHRKIIGRIFNWFVNLMVLPKLADTQCGFKLFSAEAARFLFERQKTDGFGFDVEILFIAQQAGLVIHEIPINWTNAPGSKVNLIKDSLLMFMDIFKARLRHRRVSPKDWQQLRTAQQNSNHENPLAP